MERAQYTVFQWDNIDLEIIHLKNQWLGFLHSVYLSLKRRENQSLIPADFLRVPVRLCIYLNFAIQTHMQKLGLYDGSPHLLCWYWERGWMPNNCDIATYFVFTQGTWSLCGLHYYYSADLCNPPLTRSPTYIHCIVFSHPPILSTHQVNTVYRVRSEIQNSCGTCSNSQSGNWSQG